MVSIFAREMSKLIGSAQVLQERIYFKLFPVKSLDGVDGQGNGVIWRISGFGGSFRLQPKSIRGSWEYRNKYETIKHCVVLVRLILTIARIGEK